jgi:hypothetical protein
VLFKTIERRLKTKKSIFIDEKSLTILENIITADPLSAETEKKKRNLIFLACIAILITVYGISVKFPWIEIEQSASGNQYLNGIIATLLFYSYLSYSLYALTDLRRWHITNELINIDEWAKAALDSITALSSLDNSYNLSEKNTVEEKKIYNSLSPKLMDFNRDFTIKIKDLSKSYNQSKVTKIIRIYTFDLLIPFSLGAYGILINTDHLVEFLIYPFMH